MTKFTILISLISLFSSSTFPIGQTLPIVKNAPKASGEVSGSQTLRLLNWEDYIYRHDPDNGYENIDMVEQFEQHVRDNYPELQDVNIIYSTTDTNETMLTKLETGGSHYDLICPSDYGIQKLISKDMLVKLKPLMEENELTNYYDYASPKMRQYIKDIEATNETSETVEIVDDYAVGYMWGTLGIIFNPEYDLFSVEPEVAIQEMADWSALWNENYRGSISIKDSMRDTYFVGLAETYKEELLDAKEKYDSGEYDADEYSEVMTEVLNRSSLEETNEVKKTLDELKKNIFGLEVDSGKQDIVTGKVGVNLAWSGDAVYSMDIYDEFNEDSEYGLCYSVPQTASNIWFDGWVMPKDETRSSAQEKLALLFLDFISNPENASQNMDYIGYTSFIGGDSMLDLVKDWYDIRTETLYYWDEEENAYSIFYDDPTTGESIEIAYSDYHLVEDKDSDFDDVELYYVSDEVYEAYLEAEGEFNVSESDKNYILLEDETIATFNDYLLIDEEWEVVDLSYFFNGTLDEYQDDIDTIFYSDEYLPFVNEDGTQNISVGRQFFTQYPDEETIVRCVVMKDFGKNNDNIRRMWEDFKSNAIQPWIVILFTVEVGLLAFVLVFILSKKYGNKKLRLKRRSEKNN